MERLDTRFTELDMALAALRGADDKLGTPLSPQVELSLRHYLLSRPTYSTFSVLGLMVRAYNGPARSRKRRWMNHYGIFCPFPKCHITFWGLCIIRKVWEQSCCQCGCAKKTVGKQAIF